MIHFFKRIRQGLINQDRIVKYSFYAIGEIVLVVIGILIALSINNWNEKRKLKVVERSLLRAIADDIARDTIDLNYNLNGYKEIINAADVLLDHWNNNKMKSDQFVGALRRVINAHYILTIHSSSFEEAIAQGVTSKKNDSTWGKLKRFYNFTYPELLRLENGETGYNNTYENLYPLFRGYLKIHPDDLGRPTISDEKYDQLISNENLHFEIWRAKWILKDLQLNYLKTLEKANEIIGIIEEQLKS